MATAPARSRGTPAAGTGGMLSADASRRPTARAERRRSLHADGQPSAGDHERGTTSFTVGSRGDFTVTTTGFPAPAIARGGVALPTGVTFIDNGNGTGTLERHACRRHGRRLCDHVHATNGVGATATQTFTLTVNQAPAITSANSAAFTVGAAGTFHGDDDRLPRARRRVTAGALPTGSPSPTTATARARSAGTPAPAPRILRADVHGDQRHAAERDAELHLAVNAAAGDHQRGTPTRSPSAPPAASRSRPPGSRRRPSRRPARCRPASCSPTRRAARRDRDANGRLPARLHGHQRHPAGRDAELHAERRLPGDRGQSGDDNGRALPGRPRRRDLHADRQQRQPITWSATGLPAGVTIGSTTGVVSGTPTNTVLNGAVVIIATDNFGCTGTSDTTMTVRPTTDPENYMGGVGNTQYATGAPFPATPHVAFVDNVKTGDNGPGAAVRDVPGDLDERRRHRRVRPTARSSTRRPSTSAARPTPSPTR